MVFLKEAANVKRKHADLYNDNLDILNLYLSLSACNILYYCYIIFIAIGSITCTSIVKNSV